MKAMSCRPFEKPDNWSAVFADTLVNEEPFSRKFSRREKIWQHTDGEKAQKSSQG